MNDPQMNEQDESNPYTYRVNDDLSFTVIYRGEEVHTSRAFRLRVQADRQAVEWIQRALDQKPLGAITLDVQSMSIDADSLLRRF